MRAKLGTFLLQSWAQLQGFCPKVANCPLPLDMTFNFQLRDRAASLASSSQPRCLPGLPPQHPQQQVTSTFNLQWTKSVGNFFNRPSQGLCHIKQQFGLGQQRSPGSSKAIGSRQDQQLRIASACLFSHLPIYSRLPLVMVIFFLVWASLYLHDLQ